MTERLSEDDERKFREATAKRKERLAPILAQLDAAGESTFLDLCELLVMFSEKMPYGMVKWNHPRVLVHIKMRREPKAKDGPSKETG